MRLQLSSGYWETERKDLLFKVNPHTQSIIAPLRGNWILYHTRSGAALDRTFTTCGLCNIYAEPEGETSIVYKEES